MPCALPYYPNTPVDPGIREGGRTVTLDPRTVARAELRLSLVVPFSRPK
jgi:hypothetical protein